MIKTRHDDPYISNQKIRDRYLTEKSNQTWDLIQRLEILPFNLERIISKDECFTFIHTARFH